jgi:precorrin-2 dehydrogenase/sirohydrochlorin ferrochelatase
MGATDDPGVNQQVYREALERGLLVNIADDPEHCNFLVPAILRRGELTIAISTGGRSPALARRLREELEELFPPEYAEHLEEITRLRRRLRESLPRPEQREMAWRSLMNRGLLALLREGRHREVAGLVEGVLREAQEGW